MSSKVPISVALLISINLLFSTMVSAQQPTCPSGIALKLGVCENLLVEVSVGAPTAPNGTASCCPLINGLGDLEAAVCLCTAIREKILNIAELEIGLAIGEILKECEMNFPTGFTCSPTST